MMKCQKMNKENLMAKFRQITFQRQQIEYELKRYIQDVERLQLFAEGSLGFDISKLEEIYTEAELKDLIKKQLAILYLLQ